MASGHQWKQVLLRDHSRGVELRLFFSEWGVALKLIVVVERLGLLEFLLLEESWQRVRDAKEALLGFLNPGPSGLPYDDNPSSRGVWCE